jgi:hypothetical protein
MVIITALADKNEISIGEATRTFLDEGIQARSGTDV